MAKHKDPEDGKYRFNTNGICTNPDEVIVSAGKVFSYQIDVAKNAMGWDAGYRYQVKYGQDVFSIGSTGCYRHDASQKREWAIIEKVVLLINILLDDIIKHPVLNKWAAEVNPLLELLHSLDPENKHIQLFKQYTTNQKIKPIWNLRKYL